MVINLQQWRRRHIGEACIELLQTNSGRYKFPDQDALNLTLKNRWLPLPLPLKWNVTKGVFLASWNIFSRSETSRMAREAAADPAIIHYSGAQKPWHYACALPRCQQYMELVPSSPWSGYSYPDRTLKSRIKRYEYQLRGYIGNAFA